MSKFQWTHYYQTCTQCQECIHTCDALTLTTLQRIHRNTKLCTECQTCSVICDNITTHKET